MNLHSKTAKIGFCIIAHPDYATDSFEDLISSVKTRLKEDRIDLIYNNEIIYNSNDAVGYAVNLLREDIDGVIIFLATWIEASVAMSIIREVEHLPFLLWAIPASPMDPGRKGEKNFTGSFVSLTTLQGTLRRMGYSFFTTVGLPDELKCLDTLISFSNSAFAKTKLRRTRIGLIGYASMGMYSGTFDHALLRKLIGPEVIHIDTYSLITIMQAVGKEKENEIINELESKGRFPKGMSQLHLSKVARMIFAIKELVNKYSLNAFNIKCQYELSQEYGCVACVPTSYLADEGVVASCEGDMLCTVSMVILHLLSGKSVTYGDVLEFEEGIMNFSACGFAPFSMCDTRPVFNAMTHKGFEGLVTTSVLKKGEVTLFRLYETIGGYESTAWAGDGIDTQPRMEIFPGLNIRLGISFEEFMENTHSQHYALCYGNYTSQLKELGKMLNF